MRASIAATSFVLSFILFSSYGAQGCSDLINPNAPSNCAYYRARGQCRVDYFRVRCQKTCGVCTDHSCQDSRSPNLFPNCDWYRANSHCVLSYVRKRCRRTCGVCSSGSYDPHGPYCKDSLNPASMCVFYRNRNLCNRSYVKNVCQKTCQTCW